MITKIKNNVTKFEFKNFGSIVYLIELKNKKILIDTSSIENRKDLINSLKTINLTPKDITEVILTHSHYDHIENIEIFKNAKIYSDAKETFMHDKDEINFENILPIEKLNIKEFKIIKAPGHTPYDIAILYGKILFSGDIIFDGGYIGRNDLEESDPIIQQESLKKISKLDFDILCAGH